MLRLPAGPECLSAKLLDWDSHSSDSIAAKFEELMHIAMLSDDSSRIHLFCFPSSSQPYF
jgi:hypothetical protein